MTLKCSIYDIFSQSKNKIKKKNSTISILKRRIENLESELCSKNEEISVLHNQLSAMSERIDYLVARKNNSINSIKPFTMDESFENNDTLEHLFHNNSMNEIEEELSGKFEALQNITAKSPLLQQNSNSFINSSFYKPCVYDIDLSEDVVYKNNSEDDISCLMKQNKQNYLNPSLKSNSYIVKTKNTISEENRFRKNGSINYSKSVKEKNHRNRLFSYHEEPNAHIYNINQLNDFSDINVKSNEQKDTVSQLITSNNYKLDYFINVYKTKKREFDEAMKKIRDNTDETETSFKRSFLLAKLKSDTDAMCICESILLHLRQTEKQLINLQI